MKNRKRILKRDKRICQVCGKTGAGQVHHIIPKSKGGPDSEDNLITLCGKCHLLISPVPESLLKRILNMNSKEILKTREEVERKLSEQCKMQKKDYRLKTRDRRLFCL